jgi:hypothetical protein
MDIQLWINLLLVVAIGFLALRQSYLKFRLDDQTETLDGMPEYEAGRLAFTRNLAFLENPHCGADDHSDDMMNWWAGWCVEYQKASRAAPKVSATMWRRSNSRDEGF